MSGRSLRRRRGRTQAAQSPRSAWWPRPAFSICLAILGALIAMAGLVGCGTGTMASTTSQTTVASAATTSTSELTTSTKKADSDTSSTTSSTSAQGTTTTAQATTTTTQPTRTTTHGTTTTVAPAFMAAGHSPQNGQELQAGVKRDFYLDGSAYEMRYMLAPWSGHEGYWGYHLSDTTPEDNPPLVVPGDFTMLSAASYTQGSLELKASEGHYRLDFVCRYCDWEIIITKK